MTAPVPPPHGVRRSRTGAVLGGVCAGVARSAGLDPLLLRIAVVAVSLLTGGAAVLAYLAAWVLVPREESAPGPALPAGPAQGTPAAAATGPEAETADPPEGGIPAPRSPLTAADDAATARGQEPRTSWASS